MSNYNSQLQSNNTDLQAILDTINELPNAESQETPVISVSSNGLITATAGTKSSTYQLAFQPAKTITPTATTQTAVSSGYYTGGAVTVKGDSNLVAGNIKSGVSIFGVNGTYAGSGGGDTIINGLIDKTLTSCTNDGVTLIGNQAFYNYPSLTKVSFPNVTSIGSSAFQACTKLATISFPNATSIGSYAFTNCFMLTTANFPNVISINNNAFGNCSGITSASFPYATHIGSYAFGNCKKLTKISFPNATNIGSSAFYYCFNLTTASFPAARNIYTNAFRDCYYLKSLYLTGSNICTLSNSYAFSSTPIGGFSTYAGTYGSIYVPASLLASYKKATNWTYFSSRFVGI